MSEQPVTAADAKAACLQSLQIMTDGGLADFQAVIHPQVLGEDHPSTLLSAADLAADMRALGGAGDTS